MHVQYISTYSIQICVYEYNITSSRLQNTEPHTFGCDSGPATIVIELEISDLTNRVWRSICNAFVEYSMVQNWTCRRFSTGPKWILNYDADCNNRNDGEWKAK